MAAMGCGLADRIDPRSGGVARVAEIRNERPEWYVVRVEERTAGTWTPTAAFHVAGGVRADVEFIATADPRRVRLVLYDGEHCEARMSVDAADTTFPLPIWLGAEGVLAAGGRASKEGAELPREGASRTRRCLDVPVPPDGTHTPTSRSSAE